MCRKKGVSDSWHDSKAERCSSYPRGGAFFQLMNDLFKAPNDVDWLSNYISDLRKILQSAFTFHLTAGKEKKKVRTEEKQIRELYKRNQNLSGKAGNSIHVRMPKETLTWFEMKLALRAIFPLESWVSDVLFSPPPGIDFIIRFFWYVYWGKENLGLIQPHCCGPGCTSDSWHSNISLAGHIN